MDFAVSADQRVNIIESKKRDMYEDLARELKQLRHIKVQLVRSEQYSKAWETEWKI